MGKENCYWFIPKINYEFPVSRDMFEKQAEESKSVSPY